MKLNMYCDSCAYIFLGWCSDLLQYQGRDCWWSDHGSDQQGVESADVGESLRAIHYFRSQMLLLETLSRALKYAWRKKF